MTSDAIKGENAPRLQDVAEAEDRQVGVVQTVLPLLPYMVYLVLAWRRPSQYIEVLAIDAQDVLYLALVYLILFLYALAYRVLSCGAVKALPWRVVYSVLANIPALALCFSALLVGGTVATHALLTFFCLIGTYWVAEVDRYGGALRRLAPVLWIICCAGMFAGSLAQPLVFPRLFGALLLTVLGLGQLSVLISLLSFLRWRVLFAVSGAFSVLVFACWSRPIDVPLLKSETSLDTDNYATAIFKWVGERRDLPSYKEINRPYPVILVSAEGGGIYAATHAYTVMRRMQARCPSFVQHVFAAVGVSGGAMGLAAFATSAIDDAKNAALEPCRLSLEPAPIDVSAMTADHLSPVLARAFFVDPIQGLFPWQFTSLDRASVLEESFYAEISSDMGRKLFRGALRNGWDPKGALPVMMSASTDVGTSQRIIFSAVKPMLDAGGARFFPGDNAMSDIALGQAAVSSARFPWVTPTVRLQSGSDRFVLADGGYADNSGAQTIVDLANDLGEYAILSQGMKDGGMLATDKGDKHCKLYIAKMFTERAAWRSCDIHIFIVHLALSQVRPGPSDEGEGDTSKTIQNFLLDPISTILAGRLANERRAIEAARKRFCGSVECTDEYHLNECGVNVGFYQSQLPIDDLGVPLGWRISNAHASSLSRFSAPSIQYCAEPDEQETIATILEKGGLRPDTFKHGVGQGQPDSPASIAMSTNACDSARLTFMFAPSKRWREVKEKCNLP
jgi:hypothetical protein